MTRGIRRGWPLLAGALLCAVGCKFPTWNNVLAKRDQPAVTQEVAVRAPETPPAEQAPRSAASLLATMQQKTRSWFAPDETAAAAEDVGQESPGYRETARPTFAQHDVVPPKYRQGHASTPSTSVAQDLRTTGVPSPSLAKDTAGSPSLVRPSRRPPPDPAPKLPDEIEIATVVAAPPVKEGSLYESIAAASRAWRTEKSPTATAATNTTATTTAASDEQPHPTLEKDPHLKFTVPDPGARERQTVTRHADIVKNVLRPAKSAPTATVSARPSNIPSSTEAIRGPSSGWIAKKDAPESGSGSDNADAGQTPATTADSVSPSTVVATTFGGSTRNASSPAPQRSMANSPFVPPKSERFSVWPSPAPRKPDMPVPSPEVPQIPTLAAQGVKSPSAARPNFGTHAAAPAASVDTPPVEKAAVEKAPVETASVDTAAVETAPVETVSVEAQAESQLAPLMDGAEYRARLAGRTGVLSAPVRTATRETTQPEPNSWLAAYERLLQDTGPAPARRPPAGSPSRSLRSDDVPLLPDLPAPILRR